MERPHKTLKPNRACDPLKWWKMTINSMEQVV